MSDRVFIAGSGVTEGLIADPKEHQAAALRRRSAIESAAVVVLDLRSEAATHGAILDALYGVSKGVPLCVCGFGALVENAQLALGAARITVGFSTPEEASPFALACAQHSPKKEVFSSLWDPAISTILAAAESPAETRLAVHLIDELGASDVVAQLPVTCGEKNYRLDFAVTHARIAVEVDGHDFHERTKEQAARDKSRDRALQAEGWRVLRFTGSEVWNDPRRCAKEVAQMAGGEK